MEQSSSGVASNIPACSPNWSRETNGDVCVSDANPTFHKTSFVVFILFMTRKNYNTQKKKTTPSTMASDDKAKGQDSFDIMDVVAQRARAAVDERALMNQEQQWNLSMANKPWTVSPHLVDGAHIKPSKSQCKSYPCH